jgi:hypothetical protein
MPSTLTGRQRVRHSIVAACSVLLLSAGCGSGGGSNGTGGDGFIPAFTVYWSIAVADLNGDGKPDIAVSYTFHPSDSSAHQGFVAVYLQSPASPGTFLNPTTFSFADDPLSLAIGDVNGDGKPDIVTVVSAGGLSATPPHTNVVSVLLQDPNNPGQFRAPMEYATGALPNAVAVGDLNGDGRPDLAVADTTGISVLLQNASAPGTFQPFTTLALSAPTSSVAIADLNDDNKLDLAAVSGSSVAVFLQNPAMPGTFLSPATYAAGLGPAWITAGDLNGDGRPDLAVANEGFPAGPTASLSVLLQDPSVPGGFLSARNYDTGNSTMRVAIADLNADGKPDLVVVNANNISVLLQDPNAPGQFQAGVTYAENLPIAVAVADVNGDNKPDLVITSSDGIVLRLQDPANPGAFLPHTILAK